MLTIKKKSDFGTVKEIWKRVWESIPIPYPFLSWEWQKTWWNMSKKNDIAIYVVFQNNTPLGIGSFVFKNDKVEWTGNTEVSDYLDIVANEENKKVVWEKILGEWSKEKIEKVELRNIPQASATVSILEEIGPQYGYQIQKEIEDVVPFIKLPDRFRKYIENLSYKDRHELRRKLRRLGKETKGERQLEKTNPESLEKDLNTFFTLFKKGKTEKRTFMTEDMEEFFKAEAKAMQGLNLLDLTTLTIKEEPAAAVIGFTDNDRYYLYNSAFNPKFEHLSVGLLIKAFTIKESIEKRRKIYDFMQGNERYKYELGAKNAYVYKVTLSVIPADAGIYIDSGSSPE